MNEATRLDVPRILLVDDNRAIHEDFRKIFSAGDKGAALSVDEEALFGHVEAKPVAGFQVDSAYQGQEALALVRQALQDGHPYAVAFMDVRMPPGWDGVETTAQIWKHDPSLQVVICTAYSDYSWGEMMSRLGRSDSLVILKKPFDTIEVLQLASALGEKWRLARQARALVEGLERRVAERTREVVDAGARQKALIENVSDAILVIGPDGVVRFASEAVRRIAGFEPDEVVGRRIAQFIHPDDLPKAMERIPQILREPGRILSSEYRIRHQSGGWRDVELSTRNLLDVPAVAGLVTVMRDVTERKQMEAARRVSEARYRTLFESTTEAIMTIEAPTWEFTSCNAAALRLFGAKDAAKLLTRVPWDLSPERQPDGTPSREKAAKVIESALHAGSISFDWAHLRLDGTPFLADVLLTHIAGTGSESLYATVRDITPRVEAEAARKEALRRARAQLDGIAEIGGLQAIIAGDVEALARQVTEVAARVTGVERSNVWLFEDSETELRCVDLFEATPARHSAGMVLKESQFRNEFQVLKAARYVDANDPYTDPRTAGYIEGYLKPLRITSMLDVVIAASGKNLGLLCLEHVDRAHVWSQDEIAFASQLGDKLGICIANAQRRVAMTELEEAQRVANLGSWHLTLSTGRVLWSTEISRIFGLPANVPVPGFEQCMTLLEPSSVDRLQAAIADSSRTRQAYEVELEVVRPSGEHRWIISRGEPLLDASGAVYAFRGTSQDITDRKKSELALQRLNLALKTLSAADVALVHARDEAQLLAEMTKVLHEVGGYPVALVAYAQDDERRSVEIKASAGFAPADIAGLELSWADNERGRSVTGRAIREGKTQVAEDLRVNPDDAPWKDRFEGRNVRATVALPIRLPAMDRPLGAITLGVVAAGPIDPQELKLLERLAGDVAYGIANLRTAVARTTATDKVREALVGTIAAIGTTMELRDPYTAGHQHRVAALAAAIGTEMGLAQEIIDGLHFGGQVHDLGKIQLPTEILSKPGRLSKLEYEMIKTHPQAGYDILKDIDFPWPIAQMVLQHHERLDGSGYPQGLKAGQIILEAQLLAVADVVEAMSSHRPYRPGRGIDAALAEVESKKGTWFNVAAVDACVRLFHDKRFTLDGQPSQQQGPGRTTT